MNITDKKQQVIILVSFYVNYKTGLAIGIIALTYFISQ